MLRYEDHLLKLFELSLEYAAARDWYGEKESRNKRLKELGIRSSQDIITEYRDVANKLYLKLHKITDPVEGEPRNVRSIEPVTYRGKNRIVGVLGWTPTRRGHYSLEGVVYYNKDQAVVDAIKRINSIYTKGGSPTRWKDAHGNDLPKLTGKRRTWAAVDYDDYLLNEIIEKLTKDIWDYELEYPEDENKTEAVISVLKEDIDILLEEARDSCGSGCSDCAQTMISRIKEHEPEEIARGIGWDFSSGKASPEVYRKLAHTVSRTLGRYRDAVTQFTKTLESLTTEDQQEEVGDLFLTAEVFLLFTTDHYESNEFIQERLEEDLLEYDLEIEANEIDLNFEVVLPSGNIDGAWYDVVQLYMRTAALDGLIDWMDEHAEEFCETSEPRAASLTTRASTIYPNTAEGAVNYAAEKIPDCSGVYDLTAKPYDKHSKQWIVFDGENRKAYLVDFWQGNHKRVAVTAMKENVMLMKKLANPYWWGSADEDFYVDPNQCIPIQDVLEVFDEILDIQCSHGNWNFDPYMYGMANGLLFARFLIDGKDPPYLEAPNEWLSDVPTPGPPPTECYTDNLGNQVCEGEPRVEEPSMALVPFEDVAMEEDYVQDHFVTAALQITEIEKKPHYDVTFTYPFDYYHEHGFDPESALYEILEQRYRDKTISTGSGTDGVGRDLFLKVAPEYLEKVISFVKIFLSSNYPGLTEEDIETCLRLMDPLDDEGNEVYAAARSRELNFVYPKVDESRRPPRDESGIEDYRKNLYGGPDWPEWDEEKNLRMRGRTHVNKERLRSRNLYYPDPRREGVEEGNEPTGRNPNCPNYGLPAKRRRRRRKRRGEGQFPFKNERKQQRLYKEDYPTIVETCGRNYILPECREEFEKGFNALANALAPFVRTATIPYEEVEVAEWEVVETESTPIDDVELRGEGPYENRWEKPVFAGWEGTTTLRTSMSGVLFTVRIEWFLYPDYKGPDDLDLWGVDILEGPNDMRVEGVDGTVGPISEWFKNEIPHLLWNCDLAREIFPVKEDLYAKDTFDDRPAYM